MGRTTLRSHRRPNLADAAARLAVGTALGVACFGAFAQARAVESQPAKARLAAAASSSLERDYWACDYAATKRPLDTGDAIACSVIAENLKRIRFGGDFEAMLGWWQRNKDAEHRALDAAGR